MSKYDFQETPEEKRFNNNADVIMAIILGAWLFFAFIKPLLVHFNIL